MIMANQFWITSSFFGEELAVVFRGVLTGMVLLLRRRLFADS